MTYELLLAAGPWRPLPGCPGRAVWRGDRGMTPADLVGTGTRVHVFEVEGARDPVHLALVFGGGLISYCNPDGRFVHTLNTAEGLERKLSELGIELPVSLTCSSPADLRPVATCVDALTVSPGGDGFSRPTAGRAEAPPTPDDTSASSTTQVAAGGSAGTVQAEIRIVLTI